MLIACAVLASSLPAAPIKSPIRHFGCEGPLGTSLDFRISGVDKTTARHVFSVVLAEAERLESVLSMWRPETSASRLLASSGLQSVPSELHAVLAASERYRHASDGAQDMRAGHICRRWHQAAQDGRIPTREEAASFAAEAGTSHWRITDDAVVADPTVAITVDGLGKGYILDRCLDAARRAAPEASGLLLDIGGDQRALGCAEPGVPWRVGIADPRARFDNAPPGWVLDLPDGMALATSGHDARPLRIGGHTFSHLIDPRSGWPVEHCLSASVLAPDAMEANALAAAAIVLGPIAGVEMLERAGCAGFLVAKNGHVHATRGLDFAPETTAAPTKPPPKPQPNPPAAPAAGWPAGAHAELELTLKLRRGEPRPYVAAWVEDNTGKVARVIEVWGKRSEWVREGLMDFWKIAGRDMKKAGQLNGVSKATRLAGIYKLAWDGKDASGAALPSGKYVLHVECSREHGPHSHLKVELACGGADPTTASSAGKNNDDLANISGTYQPKANTP